VIKKAIFPGCFDPIHQGHINIIKKAAKLFDKVYVAISINVDKNSSNIDMRLKIAKQKLAKLKIKNIVVIKNTKMVVDVAKEYGCAYIVRSIRNINDFNYEMNIAKNNFKLNNFIQTIFMVPDNNLTTISASNLREIARQKKLINKA
jgi:pantetheine-phosphate adenylyltransferase